jgi:epoxyqueuosine reductase QueG
MFAASPIKRIGRGRLMRDVPDAIGNSGDPGLQTVAVPPLNQIPWSST